MPKHVVVIGSGIAGVTFAEEIRKLDRGLYLTLLTRESHGYYSRPLLSHGFSRADIETKIVLRPFCSMVQNDIAVEVESDVTKLDRESKILHYRKSGEEKSLTYDTLVLATGSSAFVPPPFRPHAGLFNVLNSLDDLLALRQLRQRVQTRKARPRWAVIGGGLIGCELSADLAKAGDEVVLFHALPRLMERQLVEEDSAALLDVMERNLGVEVLLNQSVQGFGCAGVDLTVKVADEARNGFQGIIVACGFKPRIELAQECGLDTRRGILVNEFLETGAPDIFAIGDSAELPDGRLYAYVTPIRNQGLWLARYIAGQTRDPWQVPAFNPKAKVPGFDAAHPYLF